MVQRLYQVNLGPVVRVGAEVLVKGIRKFVAQVGGHTFQRIIEFSPDQMALPRVADKPRVAQAVHYLVQLYDGVVSTKHTVRLRQHPFHRAVRQDNIIVEAQSWQYNDLVRGFLDILEVCQQQFQSSKVLARSAMGRGKRWGTNSFPGLVV